MPKKPDIERDGVTRSIDLRDIDPSPYQLRKNFDAEGLKELARSILQEGLISRILVRPVGNRFELIAGERRFRAIRDYTDMQTIEAKVKETDDIGARRASVAENIQREDLTIFETIEGIVNVVDAELSDDPEYLSVSNDAIVRVNTLLSKLDAVRRNEHRGYTVAEHTQTTSRKFAGRVEKVFKKLPKSLKLH